jgi:L-ascorbate metabolism protein UlaG (beta-lactamase superfamily)
MQIKYLAHSSFLITSESNFKIITDPYTPGGALKYSPINESADVITISHSHGDHNNPKAVQGSPVILNESGQITVMGVNFKSIPVFHDESGGSKRGSVLVFCFKIDGINLCHLGDIGQSFSAQQLFEIGAVDILFIPVGGYYTIDGKQADPIAKSLNPKIIIPMHYKTPRTSYPIEGIDTFLSGKSNVKKISSFQIEIFKNFLPGKTEIIVLKSAY